MAIQRFLAGRSLDPEALGRLNKAFEGACADLGVSDKTPHSRAIVARTLLELAEGQRDPEVIRAAVVAFLKGTH